MDFKFENIIPYIKVSIGKDYMEFLPKNFFEEIIVACEKYKDCTDIDCEYSKLRFKLDEIKRIFTSTNYCDQNNIYSEDDKHETFVLNDKQIDSIITPSLYYNQNVRGLHKRTLSEIEDLCILLYRISAIDSSDYNSFEKSIINLLNGDKEARHPRSFLNYSVFQFNIKGYPYRVKNNRIWSISNVKNEMCAEEKIDTFYKNISALIDSIYCTELNTNNIGTLKNAFCFIVILSALYSEEECKTNYIRYLVGSKSLFKRLK